MTANAPKIQAKATAPGTVPSYRPHATAQLSGAGFQSIGDGASSGNYMSGGSDEPIDRAAIRSRDAERYDRPFGFQLTPDQRQLGRHGMRKLVQDRFGRSDMSGVY